MKKIISVNQKENVELAIIKLIQEDQTWHSEPSTKPLNNIIYLVESFRPSSRYLLLPYLKNAPELDNPENFIKLKELLSEHLSDDTVKGLFKALTVDAFKDQISLELLQLLFTIQDNSKFGDVQAFKQGIVKNLDRCLSGSKDLETVKQYYDNFQFDVPTRVHSKTLGLSDLEIEKAFETYSKVTEPFKGKIVIGGKPARLVSSKVNTHFNDGGSPQDYLKTEAQKDVFSEMMTQRLESDPAFLDKICEDPVKHLELFQTKHFSRILEKISKKLQENTPYVKGSPNFSTIYDFKMAVCTRLGERQHISNSEDFLRVITPEKLMTISRSRRLSSPTRFQDDMETQILAYQWAERIKGNSCEVLQLSENKKGGGNVKVGFHGTSVRGGEGILTNGLKADCLENDLWGPSHYFRKLIELESSLMHTGKKITQFTAMMEGLKRVAKLGTENLVDLSPGNQRKWKLNDDSEIDQKKEIITILNEWIRQSPLDSGSLMFDSSKDQQTTVQSQIYDAVIHFINRLEKPNALYLAQNSLVSNNYARQAAVSGVKMLLAWNISVASDREDLENAYYTSVGGGSRQPGGFITCGEHVDNTPVFVIVSSRNPAELSKVLRPHIQRIV